MRIAYTTTFNALDVENWSGTPFYMSRAFNEGGVEVEYIGSLSQHLPKKSKIKKIWQSLSRSPRESSRFSLEAAKNYSAQVSSRLKYMQVDAIVSPLANPIVYLECKQPVVLWTDALFAGLAGFYKPSSTLSAATVKQSYIFTQECLAHCKLAIFSSDWAARTALEIYGISKEKVKVVPFGANIDFQYTQQEVQTWIKSRSRTTVKLLFLGKEWHRKGGDIVFKTAKALHAAGQSVELHFVGCMPPTYEEVPSYIKCYGFVSKRTSNGIKKLTQLLQESHFLFVPSRAEAFGIVFCEANAFGLPCLTSYVGGISTVVKDNENGMTFALDTPIETYCDYIINLMANYSQYEALALTSFNAYQTRLNWNSATNTVKELIHEIL